MGLMSKIKTIFYDEIDDEEDDTILPKKEVSRKDTVKDDKSEEVKIVKNEVVENVKSDNTNIFVRDEDNSIDTKLRKMGSIIGNNVEIGCNSVICPGTIINSNVNIYPLNMVRGVIPENVIVKSMDNIIIKK